MPRARTSQKRGNPWSNFTVPLFPTVKIKVFSHGLPPNWLHVEGIKPEYSPINLLGKAIYHRSPPWEQRRKIVVLIWSCAIGLILGGICAGLILLQNVRH